MTTINEGDVLLATMRFLLSREAIPYQISVPTGQGIDAHAVKEEAAHIYRATSFRPQFVGSGPDVLALSEKEWWLVECKGAGGGKPQTQRNNFDRALASVVSYYEEKVIDAPSWGKKAIVTLGLALPGTDAYLKELRKRVRVPLRKRLNLWVLLYGHEEREIIPISPDHEYD